jgi:hypothetical protein
VETGGEAAAQAAEHLLPRGPGVPGPAARITLAADVAGAPPNQPVAMGLPVGFITCFCEPEEVEVVEFPSGFSVGKERVFGNAVAVIGLEHGRPFTQHFFEFFLPPGAGFRVGEIDHADGLPMGKAGKPAPGGPEDVTAGAREIISCYAFGKIGIELYAGLESLRAQTVHGCLGLGPVLCIGSATSPRPGPQRGAPSAGVSQGGLSRNYAVEVRATVWE